MWIGYSINDSDSLQITLKPEMLVEEIALVAWKEQEKIGPIVCEYWQDDQGRDCVTFERVPEKKKGDYTMAADS